MLFRSSSVVDFYFAKSNGFSFGDFDTIKDMVNIASAYDIIKRAGAYYSYGEQRWQGKEATLLAFREDLDMQKQLRSEVLGHFGIES